MYIGEDLEAENINHSMMIISEEIKVEVVCLVLQYFFAKQR